MPSATKTHTVYSVLYHDDSRSYGGAAGDGSYIALFRDRAKALAFAASKCHCGRPATVNVRDDVPQWLVDRWSFSG